jgi:hypothetical protein
MLRSLSVTAALLAFCGLLLVSESDRLGASLLLRGGVVPPVGCVDAVPAPAAAWGLTKETFCDNFTSASTIDTTDSKLAGFKWYIHNTWPSSSSNYGWTTLPPTTLAEFSVSSGLTMQPASATPGAGTAIEEFNTCVTNASSGYIGTTFKPPFYIDVTATWAYGTSGPPSWTTAQWWPIAWTEPAPLFTLGNSGSLNYTEFDLFEGPYGKSAHFWSWANNEGGVIATQNSQNFASGVPIGTLVIPTTMNSGTGLVKGYNNEVADASLNFTYTTSGNFSDIDNEQNCILLSGGHGWPMTITSIKIFQLP